MWYNRNCRLLTQYFRPFRIKLCSFSDWSYSPVFNPEKVLILTKLSRYDFERRKHAELTELELKRTLTLRGSDYHMLLHRHNMHKVSHIYFTNHLAVLILLVNSIILAN